MPGGATPFLINRRDSLRAERLGILQDYGMPTLLDSTDILEQSRPPDPEMVDLSVATWLVGATRAIEQGTKRLMEMALRIKLGFL